MLGWTALWGMGFHKGPEALQCVVAGVSGVAVFGDYRVWVWHPWAPLWGGGVAIQQGSLVPGAVGGRGETANVQVSGCSASGVRLQGR